MAYQGMYNMCTSMAHWQGKKSILLLTYFVNSQIWINHQLIAEHHLGYSTKFQKKQNT
jgi:hypothetical protein